MDEVTKRVRALGSWPPGVRALDWAGFGDSIAKDIQLPALMHNNLTLRKKIKEFGGIASIWRNEFPEAAAELVKWYGHPSEGRRAQQMQISATGYSGWPSWYYPQTNYCGASHALHVASGCITHHAVSSNEEKTTAQGEPQPSPPTLAIRSFRHQHWPKQLVEHRIRSMIRHTKAIVDLKRLVKWQHSHDNQPA